MEQIYLKLQKYLIDKDIRGEFDWTEDEFYVTIEWGDWKHDHWYCDDMVEQFARENSLELIDQTSAVTDEDGSDCYSAVHAYKFKEV